MNMMHMFQNVEIKYITLTEQGQYIHLIKKIMSIYVWKILTYHWK